MRDHTDDVPPLLSNAPGTTEFRKLRKRIIRETRAAIDAYAMIEPGARWLVCLSGGKDSYTLLAALTELKWRGLLPVELLACNLDQGQPGFPATVLPEFLDRMDVAYRIEYQDTYSVVTDKIPAGRTYCALCSRLRRGILYRVAREEGCSAVVLARDATTSSRPSFSTSFMAAGSPRCRRASSTRRAISSFTARSPSSQRPIATPSPAPWATRSFPAICAAVRTAFSASRSRPCSMSGRRAARDGGRLCFAR